MPVSFNAHIKPKLEPHRNCMLNAGAKSFDLTDYTQVKERAVLILIELVLEKMPPGQPYDQDLAKLIAEWIEEDYPE